MSRRFLAVSLLAGSLGAGAAGAQVPCNLPSGPPSTYRAGLTDGFTPPVDRASRRAALDAAFPAAQWIGFDDGTRDRFVGHSFTGLPAGIAKAEVVIRMRPAGGGSSNDVLHLGLNSASSFAFSSVIRDLPGAGGRWDTTPGVTFTMNLASLPGGGNILSKVASERVLDLLVQDDTTVDFVQLRVWTCPPRKLSFGLPHVELGQAQINLNALGNLVISNIGSSGEDGFQIDLGEAEGVLVESVGFLSSETAPNGAAVRFTSQHDIPGVSTGLAFRVVNGAVEATADFTNLGATRRKVEVYREGTLVASVEHSEPKDLRITSSMANGTYQTICTGNPSGSTTPADGVVTYTHICLPGGPAGGLTAVLPGGQTVTGDTFVFQAVDPQVQVGSSTSQSVTFKDAPPFTFVNEDLFARGLAHSAEGGSVLAAFDGNLTVSGIGTTSQDGVSIDLREAESVAFSLVPLGLVTTVPSGAFLEASATGSVGGTPDQPLGSLRLTQVEEGIQVTADFSEIESPTQRVQILSGGSVIADLPGRSGPVGTASAWPINLGKLGGETECYVSRHPPETTFRVGGTSYQGDELRVLAENSPSTIDFKSDFAIRASGIPEFTITDAAVGTECEPGPTHLCLNKSRFKVETRWQTPNGLNGAGQAVQLTPDTGYFWFFGSSNVEMILKVLDACGVNQSFWVFAGGLTNVAVETTVTDTATGAVQVYRNPQGTAFQPLQDTDAFATCAVPFFQPLQDTGGLRPTTAADSSLLLNNSRFRVEVEWATGDGSTGKGEAVPLTSDTGYFWFFNEENVELVIKVLNGCGLNSRYWVFAGGLTNVRTRITVTDTLRGNVRTYENPQGTPFQPLQDTSAFATCP